MKNKLIEEISKILDDKSVFFRSLEDNGIFDKKVFQSYTRNIFLLNQEELTETEKYKAVIKIWEINYKIQSLLGSNSDPTDFFCIDNLEKDDTRQISNILYYTANWFSYSKEMEEQWIEIGGWA